jgi:AP endonuclease-2
LLQGSDHCPVFATLKPTVDYNGREHRILDITNPEGIYLKGERQASAPDPQPPRLCMKRSSEFAQRQNIKELFNKIKSNSIVYPVEKSHHEKPSTPREPPRKKLKSSSSHSTLQSLKREKSNTQTTLHTFFQRPLNGSNTKSEEHTPHQTYQQSHVGPLHHIGQIRGSESSSQPASIDYKNDDDSIDTLKSKEKWAMLFTKRRPPVCDRHGDECIQLTTKKPGPNHGRAFWTCSRFVYT